MQRFITPDDPERVSLQTIWHHFVATGPTPDLARIDLIKAGPQLELRAGKATTWFAAPKPPASVITRGIEPGEKLPSAMVQSAPDHEIVCNKVVPPEALLPECLVRLNPELSFITVRDPKTRAMCKFEAITGSRDQVLASRLVCADTSGENIAKLEQQVIELQQRPAPPVEAIAKLEQGMAELQQWLVPEELAALKQQVAELQLRATSSGPHPGGAPRKYDRERILTEGAILVVMEGLPSSFEDFYGKVGERLGGESPGDTLLKTVLRPLYRRMKAELGCAETPDGQ
jgi:hypothetical protein